MKLKKILRLLKFPEYHYNFISIMNPRNALQHQHLRAIFFMNVSKSRYERGNQVILAGLPTFAIFWYFFSYTLIPISLFTTSISHSLPPLYVKERKILSMFSMLSD